MPQDALKMAQDGPKIAGHAPKMRPRSPKVAQDTFHNCAPEKDCILSAEVWGPRAATKIRVWSGSGFLVHLIRVWACGPAPKDRFKGMYLGLFGRLSRLIKE